MPGIECPTEEQLPPGPGRDLTVALHELYAGAGRPSLRDISAAISEDDDLPATLTHEAIRKILHGDVASARWKTMESLVRALAAASHDHHDVEAEVQRFLRLWQIMFDPQNAELTLEHSGEMSSIPIGRQPLRRAVALGSTAELVDAYRQLREENLGEAEEFLSAIGKVRSPHDLIEVIEGLRRGGMHAEATRIIQEAAASIGMWEIAELAMLFMKEGWRLDGLITAVAAFRTVEEVAGLLLHLQEADRLRLLRVFAQLRTAEEAKQLEAAIRR
ncbi:hypothetical protein ACIF6L_34330 [Kitasatospora sp. NPDC086009]|uniref:hypothetical protein n=1 Tax=unclassified Kitasatospora TaxID=2633591 RepID=UPI0037C5AC7D